MALPVTPAELLALIQKDGVQVTMRRETRASDVETEFIVGPSFGVGVPVTRSEITAACGASARWKCEPIARARRGRGGWYHADQWTLIEVGRAPE